MGGIRKEKKRGLTLQKHNSTFEGKVVSCWGEGGTCFLWRDRLELFSLPNVVINAVMSSFTLIAK